MRKAVTLLIIALSFFVFLSRSQASDWQLHKKIPVITLISESPTRMTIIELKEIIFQSDSHKNKGYFRITIISKRLSGQNYYLTGIYYGRTVITGNKRKFFLTFIPHGKQKTRLVLLLPKNLRNFDRGIIRGIAVDKLGRRWKMEISFIDPF